MVSAILRENAIKNWKRSWKIKVVEALNPEWRDLYDDLVGLDSGARWNEGILESIRVSAVKLIRGSLS